MSEPRTAADLGLAACVRCGEPIRLVHRFPDGIAPEGFRQHRAEAAAPAALDVDALARALPAALGCGGCDKDERHAAAIAVEYARLRGDR